MPRPFETEPDRPGLPDVYGSIVAAHYAGTHEVDNLFTIGLDSQELLARSYHRTIAFRQPDVVVFHLGLNDCAPRVFKKRSRALVLRPWFRKATRDIGMRAVAKFRRQLTWARRMTYVDVGGFRRNLLQALEEIRKFNPDVVFLAVSITRPAEWLASRSYGYAERVDEYNAVLSDLFGSGLIGASKPIGAALSA